MSKPRFMWSFLPQNMAGMQALIYDVLFILLYKYSDDRFTLDCVQYFSKRRRQVKSNPAQHQQILIKVIGHLIAL